MIESGASARKPLKALHEWLGNALYFLIGLHRTTSIEPTLHPSESMLTADVG